LGDCDGDVANGCETDVTIDAKHCGGCGHDCQGGACTTGSCQPTELVRAAGIIRLELDATHVYWSTGYTLGAEAEHGVYRCPRNGGDPEVLHTSLEAWPEGLRVRGANCYWAESGTVWTRPIDASAPAATIGAYPVRIGDLAVGDEHLYLSTAPVGGTEAWEFEVARVPLQGGSFEPLAKVYQAKAENLLIRGQRLYWLQQPFVGSPLIMTMPFASGGPEVAVDARADAMALDDADLYWLGSSTPSAAFADAVWTVPLSGGTPFALVTDRYHGVAIAIGGGSVYWTEEGTPLSTLMKIEADGGPPIELAHFSAGLFTSIVADEMTIYWSTIDGVMKLAR
jgi:hypothetical protein